MAMCKRNANAKQENQRRAIESHFGFVTYVVGKVKKIGIENVLVTEGNEKLGWLRKAYDRVLDFAEQVQLKQMPTKVTGEDEDGNVIPLVVYLPQVKSEA